MVAAYLVAAARPLRQTWPTLVAAGGLVACGGFFAGLRLDDPMLTSIGGPLLQAIGTIGVPVLVGIRSMAVMVRAATLGMDATGAP